MNIVILDANGTALTETSNYDLDLQYGDDKNNFELSNIDFRLYAGYRIQIDGTPFGGIIDTVCTSLTAIGSTLSYKGRTFQGILKDKIISPPSGSTHLVLSGDLTSIITTIINQIGLSDFFDIAQTPTGYTVSNYKFYRYINAYTALRMVCASVGCHLIIKAHDGKPIITAKKNDLYGDIPSETVYFDAEKNVTKYNHIIGLGKGEGTAREVVHFYADAAGVISTTQTLTGVNERVYKYELSSEEGDDLKNKVKKKLQELQNDGEVDIDLPDATTLDVGDKVTAVNSEHGITANSEIVDVVLKVSSGISSVQYTTGIADYPDTEED